MFDADTMLQMIARHLQNDPVPPSARAATPVPAELDEIVLCCLAKTPDERPASAAALGRSLASVGVEPWTEEAAAAWWSSARGEAPELVTA